MIKRISLIALLGLCAFAAIGCKTGPTNGAFLTVFENKCYGCGECTRVCKADAIVIINNKAVIDPAKCVRCGKCVIACPIGAIQ
jgi:electron transport complex protein RnfB